MTTVVVRGIGDIGSAVAHRLFTTGYRVILHTSPQPTDIRRGMAYTNAVFEGGAVLAGVCAGHVIACCGSTALLAPLPGVLRGLTHDNVLVETGTKVIEVDPRGAAAVVTGISKRPARIADGVLQAVRQGVSVGAL